MAEPLRHGDPQNTSLITSQSVRCTLGHHGHTHTNCSESRGSLWRGQELMQIPCVRAVSLLPGRETATQHLAY